MLNVSVNGNDGNEPIEDESDTHFTVETVTSEEAITMEKCIVFTDTLMSLLTPVHGSICKRHGCGCPLVYCKTYVGTCLMVSWGCQSSHAGDRWSA